MAAVSVKDLTISPYFSVEKGFIREWGLLIFAKK